MTQWLHSEASGQKTSVLKLHASCARFCQGPEAIALMGSNVQTSIEPSCQFFIRTYSADEPSYFFSMRLYIFFRSLPKLKNVGIKEPEPKAEATNEAGPSSESAAEMPAKTSATPSKTAKAPPSPKPANKGSPSQPPSSNPAQPSSRKAQKPPDGGTKDPKLRAAPDKPANKRPEPGIIFIIKLNVYFLTSDR